MLVVQAARQDRVKRCCCLRVPNADVLRPAHPDWMYVRLWCRCGCVITLWANGDLWFDARKP